MYHLYWLKPVLFAMLPHIYKDPVEYDSCDSSAEQASSPSLFWAPAMSLLIFQKMPPHSRPIARAMTQCMSSSVGLRMISVKVRLYRTASSRVMGVRGGFLCCSSSYCISLARLLLSQKAVARHVDAYSCSSYNLDIC